MHVQDMRESVYGPVPLFLSELGFASLVDDM